jgi:hypothetical protein
LRASLTNLVAEAAAGRAKAVALGLFVACSVSNAWARPMDPALSRLVRDASCGPAAPCLPDRAAYHKLVSQWGAALGPHAVYEARTTGLSGFALSMTGAFTGIDASADYWRRGTQGDEDQQIDGAVRLNSDPDSWLQLYSLTVQKGLGLGIEASGSIGILPHTSAVAFGGDLRVALLEGMRHGGFRYLPDVSIGVGLRQVTGLAELWLRTLALEARLSRQLVAPSGFIITPWLGYQWLKIDADSGLVDLTPSTDPVASCGFLGTNAPGMPGESEAAETAALDGSPRCAAPAGAVDYGSSVSFGEAEVFRHRVLLGLSYRQEVLKVGAELITDLVRPDAAQTDDAVAQALRCDAQGEGCEPSPRQWTLVVQLGAAF